MINPKAATFLDSLVTLADAIKTKYGNDPSVFFDKVVFNFAKIDKTDSGHKHRNTGVKIKCSLHGLLPEGTFAAPRAPEDSFDLEHRDECTWHSPEGI